MAKQGFKGQWIAISQLGKFHDSAGAERDLNTDFFEQVISNTKPNDAPAVVGHPKDNSPAFGWATALRVNNGVLEAQFADTNDDFEEMVEKGLFRKRSASFYLNPPSLRHVGFLGATPPAIKGLPEIQFNDGESVTVEISFNEEQKIMEEKDVEKVADSVFAKVKNWFKTEKSTDTPSASFSEADFKKMLDEALENKAKELTTDFTEKLGEKDKEIKSLRDDVNKQTSSGRRAEIISFVESIPAEKGKHFLKNAGIVEFMESLAKADEADEKPAISFSEGEGDKKVEHKFSRLEWAKNLFSALPDMISFGEHFGSLKATAEVAEFIDAERAKTIKDAINEGGEK